MAIFKKKEKKANEKQEQLKKIKKKTSKTWSFTKFAIVFILINAELQIWASYALALLGRDAIAEALSQQIVITIVGTIIGYFVKSVIENLSKYTTMFGKNLEFEDDSNDNIEILDSVVPDASDYNQGTGLGDDATTICDGSSVIQQY